MGALIDRAKAWFAELRRRRPFVDHVVRTVQHFGQVRGGILAGGITYFGFLSIFPILALAFFVVGYVSNAFPDAQEVLKTAIDQILPDVISNEHPPPPGKISFTQIENARDIAGIVGFVGVLYTGLGFLTNLRASLEAAFGVPSKKSYSFVVGKLRDLATLVLIGVVLMVSVTLSGAVTQFAGDLLREIGIESAAVTVTASVLGVVLGIASGTLLFFVFYKLLPHTDVPTRALWQGALVAAIGFEVVKQLAALILGAAAGGALASLALAVTLLVWIYYFAQLTLYGASWAVTSWESRTRGTVVVPHVVPGQSLHGGSPGAPGELATARAVEERNESVAASRTLLVAGGLALAAWAWVRHDKQRTRSGR